MEQKIKYDEKGFPICFECNGKEGKSGCERCLGSGWELYLQPKSEQELNKIIINDGDNNE